MKSIPQEISLAELDAGFGERPYRAGVDEVWPLDTGATSVLAGWLVIAAVLSVGLFVGLVIFVGVR